MIVDSLDLTRALPQALAERVLVERRLHGVLPVSHLLRLAEDLADQQVENQGEIQWQALFGCADDGTRGLQLQVQVDLQLLCQRCLGALPHAITIERVFHLVETEAEADQLFEADPESEIEPLAAGKKFDLAALIEDEILLDLPTIRAHQRCPTKLKNSAGAEVAVEKKPSPFAGLSALKKNK